MPLGMAPWKRDVGFGGFRVSGLRGLGFREKGLGV